MTSPVDRRRFLRGALGFAAGGALLGAGLEPALAGSAPATDEEPTGPITATRLTESLALFTGAGANVVAARGPEGLVIVDGGVRERSRDLLKAIYKEMGSDKVAALFNTHWHPGHTGCNERLGKQGVKIVAHENTKLWLGTEITVQWQNNRVYEPLPPKALPTETIYSSGKMPFGDEEIRYAHVLQAHTDGDIYVFFPKANVLAIGGILSADRWPVIDYSTGGWIGGLVEGARQLLSVANDQTRIVAGHGPILTRADLEAQQKMFATIFQRLQKSLRSGLGPDEALEQKPTAEYDAKFGDPKQFVMLAFRSMWGHFAPDA